MKAATVAWPIRLSTGGGLGGQRPDGGEMRPQRDPSDCAIAE